MTLDDDEGEIALEAEGEADAEAKMEAGAVTIFAGVAGIGNEVILELEGFQGHSTLVRIQVKEVFADPRVGSSLRHYW